MNEATYTTSAGGCKTLGLPPADEEEKTEDITARRFPKPILLRGGQQ
jgi:hypothetical protein